MPARRFTVPNRAPALTIYRALRRINPSPYLFALDLGPGSSILGASPELLVRVRDGEVVTRPLAGTRPRSDDPVRDAELEADLRADEKELAEHAMLVDLARNDVGRVAEAGSVEWPLLYGVERYSHVMHLVSEVRGRLRAGPRRVRRRPGHVPGGHPQRGAQGARDAGHRGGRGRAARRRTAVRSAIFSPDDTEIGHHHPECRAPGRHRRSCTPAPGIVADSVPARESAEVAAKAGAVLDGAGRGRGDDGGAAGEGTRHDRHGRDRGRRCP